MEKNVIDDKVATNMKQEWPYKNKSFPSTNKKLEVPEQINKSKDTFRLNLSLDNYVNVISLVFVISHFHLGCFSTSCLILGSVIHRMSITKT